LSNGSSSLSGGSHHGPLNTPLAKTHKSTHENKKDTHYTLTRIAYKNYGLANNACDKQTDYT